MIWTQLGKNLPVPQVSLNQEQILFEASGAKPGFICEVIRSNVAQNASDESEMVEGPFVLIDVSIELVACATIW